MKKNEPKLQWFFSSLIEKKNINYVEYLLYLSEKWEYKTQHLSCQLSQKVKLTSRNFSFLQLVLRNCLKLNLGALLMSNMKNVKLLLTLVYNCIDKLIGSIVFLFKSEKIINFSSIIITNLRIVILVKKPLIICGVFSEDTAMTIIKFYLLHIFVTFINFTGMSINEILKNVSEDTKNQFNKTIDLNNLKYIKIKLYEVLNV